MTPCFASTCSGGCRFGWTRTTSRPAKRLVNDADLIAHGLPLHTGQAAGSKRQSGSGKRRRQPRRRVSGSVAAVEKDRVLRRHPHPVFAERGDDTDPAGLLQVVRDEVREAHAHHRQRAAEQQRADLLRRWQPMTQISAPDPVDGRQLRRSELGDLTYDVSALMNPGNNSAGGYGETATTIGRPHTGRGLRLPDMGSDHLQYRGCGYAPLTRSIATASPTAWRMPPPASTTPTVSLSRISMRWARAPSHTRHLRRVQRLWAPAGTSYGSADRSVRCPRRPRR